MGVLLLGFQQSGQAQAAGDTVSATCPLPRVVELCVELDARASVDAAAGALTFRWQMGDGTTLTGPVISHCYTARNRYTVQLDVVDEKTGEVREAEKIIPVDFTQEVVLNFTAGSDTVRVGQPITFDAVDSQLPLCENVVVLWDFRDGVVSNGRRVQHSFRRPGQYAVRMALRGNGPNECPSSHCVGRIVTVLPAKTP
ncbi:PKD domain-containing protein [uncultured Hymenobacter sp.]|uniref:PKD domain-containing protein n=1 Tax=uncultured Hymenobacter sp. TaxID=170016 RepID=UPI0035CBC3AC